MQSIFRLPWCTDQIAPKMQTGKAALEHMRASPVLDMPMLNKLKRKRTDSPEPHSPLPAQISKRKRADSGNARHSPAAPAHLPEQAGTTASGHIDIARSLLPVSKDQAHMSHSSSASHIQQSDEDSQGLIKQAVVPQSSLQASQQDPQLSQVRRMADDVAMADVSTGEDVRGLSQLQQVIENEFNMQILLKHNELRLIEQELAKCQVALEQLRRCELRPYPGSQQLSSAVSQGTGAAVALPPGYTRPAHPAPYGVTDGPYARHYRRWLLQDPQFDPMPENSLLSMEVPPVASDARPTRTGHSARKSIQKSVTMPSRSSDAMKSLPNYPAPSKDKACYLKRSTDGQWVKLICNNCLRGNFSSIQGFLNHCRIAHKVDYKSHDAAAVDCGRLLDEQEVAKIPPEAHAAAAVHKPSTSRSSSTVNTPFKAHTSVHPLNTTEAGTFINSFAKQPVRRRPSLAPKPVAPTVPTLKASASHSAASFTPSSQAPRLSARFAKYNLGGNLEQAISNAKQKVELPVDEVLSPEELDPASPATPAPGGIRTLLGVPRPGSLAPSGPSLAARPPSRKGYREPAHRHRPTPLVSAHHTSAKQEHSEIPESPHDRSSNFSPHTADSNPGLVSDHEDDDHGSASEDEVPQETIAHSLGVSRGGCAENMDIDAPWKTRLMGMGTSSGGTAGAVFLGGMSAV